MQVHFRLCNPSSANVSLLLFLPHQTCRNIKPSRKCREGFLIPVAVYRLHGFIHFLHRFRPFQRTYEPAPRCKQAFTNFTVINNPDPL
jgi:hypothetical protein